MLCRELTSPSPLAQEILGAKPYAFLDDAPAEERRTLAVQTRRYMNAGAGRRARPSSTREAIERVRSRSVAAGAAMPTSCTMRSCCSGSSRLPKASAALGAAVRAACAPTAARRRSSLPRAGAVWVSAERLRGVDARAAGRGRRPSRSPCSATRAPSIADVALRELVRSRFEALGPVTAEALARPFGLRAHDVLPALARARAAGHGDARDVHDRHGRRRPARSGASGGCSRASIATR